MDVNWTYRDHFAIYTNIKPPFCTPKTNIICHLLAWEIPWTEEHGGLQSMESQRIGHNLVTKQQSQ